MIEHRRSNTVSFKHCVSSNESRNAIKSRKMGVLAFSIDGKRNGFQVMENAMDFKKLGGRLKPSAVDLKTQILKRHHEVRPGRTAVPHAHFVGGEEEVREPVWGARGRLVRAAQRVC